MEQQSFPSQILHRHALWRAGLSLSRLLPAVLLEQVSKQIGRKHRKEPRKVTTGRIGAGPRLDRLRNRLYRVKHRIAWEKSSHG